MQIPHFCELTAPRLQPVNIQQYDHLEKTRNIVDQVASSFYLLLRQQWPLGSEFQNLAKGLDRSVREVWRQGKASVRVQTAGNLDLHLTNNELIIFIVVLVFGT